MEEAKSKKCNEKWPRLTPAGKLRIVFFFINRYIHIAESGRISEHYGSCVLVTLFCIDRCHRLIIKPTKPARLVVVAEGQSHQCIEQKELKTLLVAQRTLAIAN